ncbi:hypothetical protein Tco_1471717 [Tanacetum coccineum]
MRTLDVTNVAKKVILQEIAFLKRLNKSPSSYLSSVSKCFLLKFTPKLIQSSQHTLSSQDEEEVSDDDKETRVQVLMALADGELSVGKNRACNGEWIDITMKKVNILLSMDEDSDWQSYLKYIHIDLKSNSSIGVEVAGFGRGIHTSEEFKASCGITTPKGLRCNKD